MTRSTLPAALAPSLRPLAALARLLRPLAALALLLWPLAVLALLLWPLAAPVRAESTYRCASEIDADLAVVHVNGMMASTERAQAGLAALRGIVEELGHPLTSYEMDLAYKQTRGALVDLQEVVREAEAASISQFVGELVGLETLSPVFVRELEKLAERRLRDAVNQEDLARQEQVVNGHIRRGQKVLVVAHSQGNFYANALYTSLFVDRDEVGEEAFRIVAVATPAPRVVGAQADACPGGRCYTTFHEDVLINALRRLDLEPGPLPANLHVSRDDLPDWTAHRLVDGYLADPVARDAIVAQMQAQLGGLVARAPRTYDGVLTASLAWDTDADLDLHVIERDGRDHVYWDHPTGAVGSLDVDSQSGLVDGEDYTAYCGTMERGEYAFEVQYYGGEGPVTARLLLWAGDEVRHITRVLEGPSRERVHLATVDVTDLGQRAFRFVTYEASDEASM